MSHVRSTTPKDEKRELIFKEDGQEYAQVLRMLGNGRLEAACIDGVKRLCHIRGKMRKKVWVSAGDVILLGLREYQDEKADVILKYAPDEARSLKAYGELPDNFRIDVGVDDDGAGSDDDVIEFDDQDRPDLDLDLADSTCCDARGYALRAAAAGDARVRRLALTLGVSPNSPLALLHPQSKARRRSITNNPATTSLSLGIRSAPLKTRTWPLVVLWAPEGRAW